MSVFSRFDAGPVAEWNHWSFQHPRFSRPAPGKLFLGDRLELSGMEVSLNTLPSGIGMPFIHKHHRHEEVYVFLAGTGEFQVDDRRFRVSEGSTVRVGPEGERAWRNIGTTPLVYIVIQATEGSLDHNQIEDGEVVDRPVVW